MRDIRGKDETGRRVREKVMDNEMRNKTKDGNGKNSIPASMKTASVVKKAAGFLVKGVAILAAGYLLLVTIHSPGDVFRTAVFHLQTMGIDKSDCEIIRPDSEDHFASVGGYASNYDMVYTDEKRGKKLTVHVYDVFSPVESNPWERGRHYSDIKITDI